MNAKQVIREHVLAILNFLRIDPDEVIELDSGETTAYDHLEGCVNGALDEIEDAVDA